MFLIFSINRLFKGSKMVTDIYEALMLLKEDNTRDQELVTAIMDTYPEYDFSFLLEQLSSVQAEIDGMLDAVKEEIPDGNVDETGM